MTVKKIYISVLMGLVLGMSSRVSLPAVDKAPGADSLSNTSAQYENYLVIKYLLYSNEFEKAEAAIDRFLGDYPGDPFILTEKAFLLSQVRDKFPEALALLQKARAVYPSYYYANYLQAFILYSMTNLGTDTGTDTVKIKKKDKKTLAQAIKYLKLALEDNPEFYDAHYLMGVVLNARGEYKESNRCFEQANRLEQNTAAYFYMASNYRHLNDTDGAIRTYKEVLSLSPSQYLALSALSEIYLEKKNVKEASYYLEKLFRKYPTDQTIAFRYLYTLIATGETGEFLKIVENVDISESPLLMLAKALVLTQEKKYAEVEQILKAVKPQEPRDHLLMAQIHLHRHNYFQAYQSLGNIPSADKDPSYYSDRLRILSALNLNRQILKLFDFLRQNPPLLQKLTIDDYYTFWFACANSNQVDTAREVLQAVKSHFKNPPEFFTDLLPALEDFFQGKDPVGKMPRIDLNVILIETFYKKQKRYTEAVSLLEQLIRMDSLNQDAYLELCDIYQEQGQSGQVEQLLEKLIRQFPGSMQVKNHYAYFLAQQNQNLEKALELSALTLVEEKENPAYLDTYGYILLRLGRYSEAVEYLEKAYRKHPLDREIMDHLADCYRFQQENPQPRILEMYKKAIDHDVDFKEQLIKQMEQENEKKQIP